MPIIDAMLAELEHEASTTRRVLERVPDSKLTWKPHEKSMTLAQLATHVATIPGRISEFVAQDSFDLASGQKGKDATSHQELLDMLAQGIATAKQKLAGRVDAWAIANWTLLKDGKTVMTLPRVAVIRSILLNHGYHHRGQLSVYLRMLDVPLPSIYGPSADENPFA